MSDNKNTELPSAEWVSAKTSSRQLRMTAPHVARTEPHVKVGDVVAVRAADWAVYVEQVDRDYDWQIIRGTIYGEVIAVNGDGVLMIPPVCISSITILTGVA